MSKMTLGEFRVGISFNPSGNKLVDEIKRAAADLIDLCDRQAQAIAGDTKERGEIQRLWALAMTDIEVAAMHAVKAATKKPLQ